jgi:cysteine-rich repeat protein
MSPNLSTLMMIRLLATMLAITIGPGCRDTDRSDKPVAFTCPPSMTRAVRQDICLHDSCGNGTRDADEACDDGNVIAGDGCSPDCRSTETCGNGTVDHAVGEVCDDGNTAPDDRCCSDCRSCPEFAVRPNEPDVPAAVHVATEPEPCPPVPPAPVVTSAVAVQEAPGAAPANGASPRAHAVLRPVRPATPAGLEMGGFAEQSHGRMSEELALARSTIAELEQRNAELRLSLEGQLQQLEEMQQRLIRGTALQ